MSKAERVRIIARGAVQGVGFRPFVYRLATELNLNGWVSNSAAGVFIEAEGTPVALRAFLIRVEKEKPARAVLQGLEWSFLDDVGYVGFEIRQSEDRGEKTALILPDIATCTDCLRDIFDPANRRFRYPFTNCTNCGPRFSIIEALPYDRANTAMRKFPMCDECEREYYDPLDRRFHAQPNACPRCGPQLELWDEKGALVSTRDRALRAAADAVRAGEILALKGIGGFQLIVDARNEGAVIRVRQRKHREEKPFALMFPSLADLRDDCEVSELEERLLLSPESPILHLSRKFQTQNAKAEIAASVAPRNPNLGAMLPYSPLHHLLMRELNFPIVATSGNLTDEPICIDEREALERLRGIADTFLVHNRPVVRHVDDSIARIVADRELLLRRARGYAPLPIALKSEIQNPKSKTILAVGAHLKNTVAISVGVNVFIAQHIGDLATREAYEAFLRTVADLPRLYDAKPTIVAHDLHPDYLSTKHAQELAQNQSPITNHFAPLTLMPVQHHFAHIASCMAENEIEPPVLGLAWDGTGLGLDGTIWGGEFLGVNANSFERVAHFREFRLPGGDVAIKEPRRSALGLLYEIFSDELWERRELLAHFSEVEQILLRPMLEKNINAPITSSAGRLFDAIAALIGLRQRASFEGQAAMELEFERRETVRAAYSFRLADESPMIVDWEPLVRELLEDVARGEEPGVISAKFHNMMVETIMAVSRKFGERKIVLSGGCFQNRYLIEHAIERLRAENFQPYWHQRVPPNDGGISLGQVAAAVWSQRDS